MDSLLMAFAFLYWTGLLQSLTLTMLAIGAWMICCYKKKKNGKRNTTEGSKPSKRHFPYDNIKTDELSPSGTTGTTGTTETTGAHKKKNEDSRRRRSKPYCTNLSPLMSIKRAFFP